MNMKLLYRIASRRHVCRALAVVFAAGSVWQTIAQPAITSVVPPRGGSGVSPSAQVIFDFSEAMDPASTSASFFSIASPTTPLGTTTNWTQGNTVLTCTPNPPFPSNTMIIWTVDGQTPAGDPLSDGGFFTTASGGGGTGSGTNRITGFAVGKINYYAQASAASPVPDTNAPYLFGATTTLASNRTANSITVQLPTGATSNLTQNLFRQEIWSMDVFSTNGSTFDLTYPAGNYTFNLLSSQSNQTAVVNLPASMTQPNPPHITNFAAAQSVNASQAFLLAWDSFTGGGGTDFIFVEIGGVWKTPDPFTPGALNGTATSVTIPAGALQANSNYVGSIIFYHALWTSNVTYTTAAYRATATEFTLQTAGSSAPPPVVTNVNWNSGAFSFDVSTSVGQTITVVYTTNLALPVVGWPILVTTNSPGTKVRITDSNPTGRLRLYRARNGS